MDEGRDFALVEVLLPESFRAIERAVPAKDRPVVVYCQNKNCHASPEAAERMEQSGYQQVYDYEAGAVLSPGADPEQQRR